MIYSVSTPSANEIKMAYNPIQITVFTSGINPAVYVDIYMNGTYYKTISGTSPTGSFSGFNYWQFDIRDAAQEYLRTIAPYFAIAANQTQPLNAGVALCTVKVRGSSVTGGFTVPDTPVPVQATVDNPAVPGGGVTAAGAPSWMILNGALQLEQDPVPATFLPANNPGFLLAGYKIWNLFTNPRLTATKDTLMRLPVIIPTDGLTPGAGPIVASDNYYLIVEDDTGNFYYFTNPGPVYATYSTFQNTSVYYLPAGPKNFAGLGVAFGSVPNWDTIKRYRMILTPTSFSIAGTMRWKSPWITITKPCAESKRFIFANWLGHYDTITFDEFQEEFRVSAAGWEQYNIGNFNSIGKEAFGKHRYNVRSSELVTVTGYFKESEMFHVKQFLSNPLCYIEMKGTAGQLDYMLPVRLLDVTAMTRKVDERYIYIITVQVEPANERINIRN